MIFDPVITDSCHKSLVNGICSFEISEAQDKVSSNGNQMTVFKLKVTDQNNTSGFIWDNIAWILNWKIGQLLQSLAMEDRIQSGDVPSASLIGKTGKCFLFWKKGSGGYPDKLAVKYYVSAKASDDVLVTADSLLDSAQAISDQPSEEMNDDVPF